MERRYDVAFRAKSISAKFKREFLRRGQTAMLQQLWLADQQTMAFGTAAS